MKQLLFTVLLFSNLFSMETIDDRYEGSCEQGCIEVCKPYSVCAGCSALATLLNLRSDRSDRATMQGERIALNVTVGGLCGVYLGIVKLKLREFPCDHSCLCGKCRKLKRRAEEKFGQWVPQKQSME